MLCQFLSTLVTHLPQLIRNPSQGANNPVRVEVLLERLSAAKPVAADTDNRSQTDNSSILAICGLVFQLSTDRFLTDKEGRSLLLAIASRTANDNQSVTRIPTPVRLSSWLAYQVARQASRYGQHMLASAIYGSLSPQALSERSSYWIQGLVEFSRTEATIISVARRLRGNVTTLEADENTIDPNQRPPPFPWVLELIDALRGACDSALKARTTLICVGGPDTRWFQAEYVALRADLFSNLAELCSNAYHHSRVGRWPGQTNSIPGSAPCTPFWLLDQLDVWNALAERLATFQAQCLDAEPATLEHLSAQENVSHEHAVVPFTSSQVHSSASSHSDPFSAILPDLETVARKRLNFKPVAFANFDWIPGLVLTLVRTASHWPRFFFQRLQTTNVRLVLLPKAGNNPDDVLTISNEVGHMIQVMGVVQQHSRRGPSHLSRRITLVEVELTVTELPFSGHYARVSLSQHVATMHDRDQQSVVFYSKRSAPLQRDYFHCDFCVHFPGHVQGKAKNGSVSTDKLYAIQASPILIDGSGERWRLTGVSGAPKEVTLVRVECVRTANTTVASVSSTTSSSGSVEPAHQSTSRSVLPPPGTAKVDINRTSLDAQFSLTKPRPIGRPVGETTVTPVGRSTATARSGPTSSV
ncbi:unnamed protein product [Echinostoma caproni]|uniref:Integrator complex subunit 7 n=1 Tax=Echinostoma caproni TaxID=27848 RepID=A0A3P8FPZ7_9TREM|nr:unnamed protein product [Echinostoma caproni]